MMPDASQRHLFISLYTPTLLWTVMASGRWFLLGLVTFLTFSPYHPHHSVNFCVTLPSGLQYYQRQTHGFHVHVSTGMASISSISTQLPLNCALVWYGVCLYCTLLQWLWELRTLQLKKTHAHIHTTQIQTHAESSTAVACCRWQQAFPQLEVLNNLQLLKWRALNDKGATVGFITFLMSSVLLAVHVPLWVLLCRFAAHVLYIWWGSFLTVCHRLACIFLICSALSSLGLCVFPVLGPVLIKL